MSDILTSDQTTAIMTQLAKIMDSIQNGVVTVAGQAIKYTPDVMDAALMVIRIDNIQQLIKSFVFLVLGIILIYVLYKQAIMYRKSDYYGKDSISMWIFFTAIPACIINPTGLIGILNIWTWVGIFQPKLYIAHLLMEKVMK